MPAPRDAATGQLPQARLPAWCLPPDWPRPGGEVAPARIAWRHGVIEAVTPVAPASSGPGPGVEAAAGAGPAPGAGTPRAGGTTPPIPLVLPALVQAHAHLDKAFTAHRAPSRGPGLLAAIEAVVADRQHWSADDLRARMANGLQDAWHAGVALLRTHVDWPDAEPPLAWDIAGELAQDWRGRVRLERVALVPLRFFAERAMAMAIAARVAAAGQGAVLGGFIHTSNWNAQAVAHLLQAAQAHDLDLDLHVDEELNPQAQGVATVVRLAGEMRLASVVACSHACALAVQPLDEALATLDAMARLPGFRLIALPATNLLLQDARSGATPRQRGLTLVHEARARGVPVLIASDNVQDPFARGGSLDPLEAFWLGLYAAQLDDPFDSWSDAICRPDWLSRKMHSVAPAAGAPATPALDGGSPLPLMPGQPADLVCFAAQAAGAWPALATGRRILRHGEWLAPRDLAPGPAP